MINLGTYLISVLCALACGGSVGVFLMALMIAGHEADRR